MLPKRSAMKDTYVPTMRTFDDLTLAAKHALDQLRPYVRIHFESHRKRDFSETCEFCRDRLVRQAKIAELRVWLDREVEVLLERAQKKAAAAEASNGVR